MVKFPSSWSSGKQVTRNWDYTANNVPETKQGGEGWWFVRKIWRDHLEMYST